MQTLANASAGAVARREQEFCARNMPRNMAVDAYRGLVMVLMMGEVLHFADVARAFPGSTFWRILAYNQTQLNGRG